MAEKSAELQLLLRGKTVRRARRDAEGSLILDFEDGTRLYVRHFFGGSPIFVSIPTGESADTAG